MTVTEALLLAAGAVALLALLPRSRALRRPPHPAVRRRRGRRRAARASAELDAVERMLSMSVSRDEDAYVRLRPVVRDIAAQRLADHAGVRLDVAPDVAERLLGPEAWDLIRPGRPRSRDRHARGLPAATLESVIGSLERIGGPE